MAETGNTMDEIITGYGRKMMTRDRVDKCRGVVVIKLDGICLVTTAAGDRIIYIEYL